MTYLALNAVFIAVAVIVLAIAVMTRRLTRTSAPAIVAAVLVVFVMTTVFDNLMIAVGLFAYTPQHTSGILIGLAPIEDFGYPLAAALLLPALWLLFGGREDQGQQHLTHKRHPTGGSDD